MLKIWKRIERRLSASFRDDRRFRYDAHQLSHIDRLSSRARRIISSGRSATRYLSGAAIAAESRRNSKVVCIYAGLVPRGGGGDCSVRTNALGQWRKRSDCLAEQLHADVILIDETRGRRVARQRGLLITGTIGVLDKAAEMGLIDIDDAVDRLKRTTFRASAALFQKLNELKKDE